METDAIHRYRSRILREMNANRANPFNSPPSSTGSHGTVTMSSLFSDPDGESTRRLNEDIARVTAPRKLPVNWEAAHRKWPQHFSKPDPNKAPVFDDATDIRPWKPQSKENRAPVSNVKPAVDDSTQDIWTAATKTRAEIQPRVDNESELSFILDKSPARPASYYGAASSQKHPSPLSKPHARAPSEPIADQQRPSSITDALSRLQRASLSPRNTNQDSPHMSSGKSSLTAVAPSPASMASPGHDASNVRSFFMPDVSRLGDFVTGTLKFSGSMKNGVPIFVKHGKVHDRQERPNTAAHAQVDGIEVPEDEEKIFVSMDMIRDEIVSLQAAHDKVQEYAEGLQLQVQRLEAQFRHGRFSGGSHDESEKLLAQKKKLELEVATLQARLDDASRKMSTNEIANDAVAHERDRAIVRLQDACEDISKLTRKLSVREKELSTSREQLETSDHIRRDNDTLRRDLASLKHSRDALELDNASLRSDNEKLRKEQKRLREQIDSLRAHQNSRNDECLLAENRSLRASNDRLTEENEDLRENLDGAQHELDAAREEIDTLRAAIKTITQEKSVLQADNDSLVRHNEKYFNENKILRRENSGFERSVHDLHEENLKRKEEVDFLKQQLDHCRPSHKNEVYGRSDGETEENMTSAYFLPDITVKTNESRPAEATETKDMPTLPEVTAQVYTHEQETREMSRRTSNNRQRSRSRPRASSKGVAFSIPEKAAVRNKNVGNTANQGSKRRHAKAPLTTELDLTHDEDEMTGDFQSEDFTNQDAAISLSVSMKDVNIQSHREVTTQSNTSRRASNPRPAQKHTMELDTTDGPNKTTNHDTCPALSTDARRVLDGLCEHSCRNCIVCSRITSHRGVISSSEAASGKKRVTVSRPVPVTDRSLAGDDPTIRPSQSPGHALALVIKGLEDEAEHLQLELSRLQAEYNRSDKAIGRRDRMSLAESIRTILKRMEVKNDQIYSLYDVLEGQKLAGQAMTEEEVEMTVLNITGMTVRDVTGGSEQFTWEGIQETN
ncbi:rhoptry protein [Metarhizium album ARSEF 1941]|uniref:Rhoptry protein n=1 Tax=Metarhizium album (strain ARSEF 1941) TaxID=1081103 RepID=A0A0B2WKH7_METAS|nr:rhoptry protein [Metarhizium album ARSEF 1941]KHN93982.1 rhoptry protein [Metarhizium album ARSEF 1941]